MICAIVATFPRKAPADLKSQLTKAALSISSAISEGFARGTRGEKLQSCRVARGSLEESQNDLKVSVNLKLVCKSSFYRAWSRSVAINRMLANLMVDIERRPERPKRRRRSRP
jgi:four helix bundle protein